MAYLIFSSLFLFVCFLTYKDIKNRTNHDKYYKQIETAIFNNQKVIKIDVSNMSTELYIEFYKNIKDKYNCQLTLIDNQLILHILKKNKPLLDSVSHKYTKEISMLKNIQSEDVIHVDFKQKKRVA